MSNDCRICNGDDVERQRKMAEVIVSAQRDARHVGADAAIAWAIVHYDLWLRGKNEGLDPLPEPEAPEPMFGTHIREAIAVCRDIWRRWRQRKGHAENCPDKTHGVEISCSEVHRMWPATPWKN